MALSVDLRGRVLAAHERREGSQRLLAERFGVALGTVNAWLRQAREGRRAPRRRGGPAGVGGGQAGGVRGDVGGAVGGGVRPRRAVPGAAARRSAAEEKTLHASEQERPDVAAARATWRAGSMDQIDSRPPL